MSSKWHYWQPDFQFWRRWKRSRVMQAAPWIKSRVMQATPRIRSWVMQAAPRIKSWKLLHRHKNVCDMPVLFQCAFRPPCTVWKVTDGLVLRHFSCCRRSWCVWEWGWCTFALRLLPRSACFHLFPCVRLVFFPAAVHFIDYEYAFLNYQAFDIGNHFCEYAGTVAVFLCHYSQFMSLSVCESPWYNHTGWLGIKSPTYLPVCDSK